MSATRPYDASRHITHHRAANPLIGRRLAARGQLDRHDDVFFLTLGEGRAALRDGQSRRALAARRRGERAFVEQHLGPVTYGERPGPPPPLHALPAEARFSMTALLWYIDRVFGAAPSSRVQQAGAQAVDGIAASPGRYTGPLAYLTEAFAAAAALQAAGRLGVLARLDGGPATATELAGACAISQRGARLLLGALAGLGLAEGVEGGTWRAALPDLSGLAGTAGIWAHLDEALRGDRPPVSGDTPDGAAALYPEVVGHLGAMLAGMAERAATLLPPAAWVLDAGAGAAPGAWRSPPATPAR